MIYRQENSETKTRWNRFEKAPHTYIYIHTYTLFYLEYRVAKHLVCHVKHKWHTEVSGGIKVQVTFHRLKVTKNNYEFEFLILKKIDHFRCIIAVGLKDTNKGNWMVMLVHLFGLCPLALTIKLKFNISKVAYCDKPTWNPLMSWDCDTSVSLQLDFCSSIFKQLFDEVFVIFRLIKSR